MERQYILLTKMTLRNGFSYGVNGLEIWTEQGYLGDSRKLC